MTTGKRVGQRRVTLALGGLASVGLATAAYGTLVERNLFALRRFTVPVLPPGSPELRVLHLSDLHVTPQQRRKVRWIRELDALDPHVVLSTGDHVGGNEDAFENTLGALEPLLKRPGAFVWGNNDHFAPIPKSPVHYFTRTTTHRRGSRIPLTPFRERLVSAGWLDLNNAVATLTVNGLRLGFGGVDDPHTRRDRFAEIAGRLETTPRSSENPIPRSRDKYPTSRSSSERGTSGVETPQPFDVRIGLTHSPEPRVLDWFADDGYDLVLAGHTHGGQVRVPLYGAPTTNCGIDRARVRWLSSWRGPSGRECSLHVSAGLGTSPYAPVRFCCRPEATLLTLVPRQ